MPPPRHTPAVSVVMATYNRSNIIGYAIQSLRSGNFQDWELLIIGDACTDDTASVIERIGDPRIRFINLDQNWGEQSGPNNQGAEMAKGEYLAFLNHDDLWLPNHLERSVQRLQETDVDLVFGQGLAIGLKGHTHAICGALCDFSQPYQAWMIVPASLWVMRRNLIQKIGPWKRANEIRAVPSQEWLYRAHQSGAQLLADPVVSAVLIQSGNRKNSYRKRLDHEHKFWVERLKDPNCICDVLSGLCGQSEYQRAFSPLNNASNLFKSLIRKLMVMCRFFPPSPKYWLRYHSKGSFLRKLRRTRGLNPRLPNDH
ncbi:glycosyltransferase family 2 protein [Zwartia sp.]|uniref:glycosyltransferase family 2 protein n=1 Tax=Zwartia sp. TaxID=2978004 RepID=UPI002724A6DF|nr:glycosyltransferase family 2 protein [Zwartia sp.]MDO9023580.1 glycosyltransferase family 2 protein [Zwartia sp.]